MRVINDCSNRVTVAVEPAVKTGCELSTVKNCFECLKLGHSARKSKGELQF